MSFDYDETFARNFGMLSPRDVERIRGARIGIAGLGGVGGNYLLALVRLGFERFTLLDGDVYEPSNSNRQPGAIVRNMGRPKVEVMREMALEINPGADLRVRQARLGPDTVEFFFDGIDFAINGIDYLSASAYGYLHDGARDRGLYSVTVSPVGLSASLTTFGPSSPSFAECFGIDPADDEVTNMRKFLRAVTPARLPFAYLPRDQMTPSVSPAIYLSTAMAAAEVLLTVTGRRAPILAPNILQIDLLTRAMAVTPIGAHLALARDP